MPFNYGHPNQHYRTEQVFKGPALDIILDKCLEEMRTRHATIGECIRRYPGSKSDLTPLLEMASELAKLPAIHPSAKFKRTTRNGLLGKSDLGGLFGFIGLPWSFQTWIKAIVLALGVSLVAVAGIAFAASASLPGTSLYMVKRGTEKIQFAFVQDPISAGQLHATMAERRLHETVALAEAGQDELAEGTAVEYQNEVNAALNNFGSVREKELSPAARHFGEGLIRERLELQRQQSRIPARCTAAIELALSSTDNVIQKLGLKSTP